MMKKSVFAAATFAFALASAVPNVAAAQGTPGGQTGVGSGQTGGNVQGGQGAGDRQTGGQQNNQGTMPADQGATGTRTQAGQGGSGDFGSGQNQNNELPSTASPLALLALAGAAALGGRAALRRFGR
jgi:hypothetical protein